MEQQQQTIKRLVLVTGATGYVAGHVIKELLAAGYLVRATVRKLSDSKKYDYLLKLPGANGETLTFIEADLLNAASWGPACSGCEYVMHVASPYFLKLPKNETEELIKPAVDGTLNVVKAAVEAGVKKVVVTSSTAAVMTGHKEGNTKIYDENDWSDVKKSPPYQKSKTLAEKALWEYYEQVKDKIEITALNPSGIWGPLVGNNPSTSTNTMIKFMNNEMPGIPQIAYPMVDVRDVAKAHLLALENPRSNGRRYILAAKTLWLKDIADILGGEFTKQGYKIPSKTVGKFLIRVASWFDADAKMALPLIGNFYRCSNTRSVEELKLEYTPAEQTIIQMGYSLIEHNMVKPPKTK